MGKLIAHPGNIRRCHAVDATDRQGASEYTSFTASEFDTNNEIMTKHTLQIMLFDRSIGVVVQLSVIEYYGIIIFRTERSRSSGGGIDNGSGVSSGASGKLYVFRLSEVEEFLIELSGWHNSVDSLLANSSEVEHDITIEPYS